MESSYNSFYYKWSLGHSLINVLGLLISLWLMNINIWLVAVGITFLIYLLKITKFTIKTKAIFSYANWVTILRLLIVLILGFLYSKCTNGLLFTGFLLVISLDGVDGHLARKYNQSSKVGEYLDMETDALMVLLLSYIHFASGFISWWILIPGGLRYYAQLLLFKLKKEGKQDIPKRIRSVIAVIFFISLLGPFILPHDLSFTTLVISSSLIILSFISSVLYGFKRPILNSTNR